MREQRTLLTLLMVRLDTDRLRTSADACRSTAAEANVTVFMRTQTLKYPHPLISHFNKNLSGDEIANVTLLTTISHTYSTSKYQKEPTSFNKLDDS